VGRRRAHPEDDIDYESIATRNCLPQGGVREIVSTQRDRVAKKIAGRSRCWRRPRESEAAVREAMKVWRRSPRLKPSLTEAVHAFNEGTLSCGRIDRSREVYVQDGDDHDEPCQEADGRCGASSKARENRLEHPRCRRSFLPLNVVPS
jgi:hypothetical protein